MKQRPRVYLAVDSDAAYTFLKTVLAGFDDTTDAARADLVLRIRDGHAPMRVPALRSALPGCTLINQLTGPFKDAVTRKDAFAARFKGAPFIPATTVWERAALLALAAQHRHDGTAHILKPADGFGGAGVAVVTNGVDIVRHLTAHTAAQRWVLQRYIRPATIAGGYKFHLRVWVLVTCFAGAALAVRLATRHFIITAAKPYVHGAWGDGGVHDSHMKHSVLKGKTFPDVLPDGWTVADAAAAQVGIRDAVRVIFADASLKPDWGARNGFEIFGLDVLFDAATRAAYVLEVNDRIGYDATQLPAYRSVLQHTAGVFWHGDYMSGNVDLFGMGIGRGGNVFSSAEHVSDSGHGASRASNISRGGTGGSMPPDCMSTASLPGTTHPGSHADIVRGIVTGVIAYPYRAALLTPADKTTAFNYVKGHAAPLRRAAFEFVGYAGGLPVTCRVQDACGNVAVRPIATLTNPSGRPDNSLIIGTDKTLSAYSSALLDAYTEASRMQCIPVKAVPPLQAWRDPTTAAAIVTKAARLQQRVRSEATRHSPEASSTTVPRTAGRGRSPRAGHAAIIDDRALRCATYGNMAVCTIFRAHMAKTICELFGATAVLDPCAGWGDRLQGAIAASRVTRYVGFDPNPGNAPGYAAIIKDWAEKGMFGVHTKPFEAATTHELSGEFDLVLTSPPYFDKEVYVAPATPGYDAQSLTRFATASAWVEGWALPMFARAWGALRVGGHCAIYVEDVPNPEGVSVCRRLLEFSATLPDCVFLGVIGIESEGGGTFRPLWCWRKVTGVLAVYAPRGRAVTLQVLRDAPTRGPIASLVDATPLPVAYDGRLIVTDRAAWTGRVLASRLLDSFGDQGPALDTNFDDYSMGLLLTSASGVAVAAGRLVFYAHRDVAGRRHANVLHARSIAVNPCWRGRGLCAVFMRAVIAAFGPSYTYTLDVDPANAAAVKCYARVGYKKVDARVIAGHAYDTMMYAS